MLIALDELDFSGIPDFVRAELVDASGGSNSQKVV